jgi:hypothetical protein
VEQIEPNPTFGVLNVSGKSDPVLGITRLRYEQHDRDVRILLNTDIPGKAIAAHWKTTRDDGIKFAPDMSVMFEEDGTPQLTHAGTGTLFDILQDVRDKSVKCYVIRFGDMAEYDHSDHDLVRMHLASGAPLTALVAESSSPYDNRPVLVRTNSGLGLYDPRDLATVPNGPRLVEYGAYVVSSSLLEHASFSWTHRRRRYHIGGKIWFQIEHDMCQLTQLFMTNYVRL